MTKRAHISDKVGLAAALLQIPGADIPLEHAKLMTADQIISLFHRDHWPIRKEAGGPDEPWNLHWKPILVHREKTAKVDVPEIAKGKRIRRKLAHHQASITEKYGAPAAHADINTTRRAALDRLPKLRSRGFDKTQTRGFGGKVRPRKQRRQL